MAPPAEATGVRTALEEAMWLLGREEYEAAVEAFRHANREGGGHCGECLLGLAKALERLDRVEPAISTVREAIAALDGSALSGTAYVDLGRLLLGRDGPGDLNEADRAFTRALQILAGRPNRAAALSGMAMVRLRQKRYVDAVEASREALAASASGPTERQARIALCLARGAGSVPGPVSVGPWRRWFSGAGEVAAAATQPTQPAIVCPLPRLEVTRFERRRPMCDRDAWVSLFDLSSMASDDFVAAWAEVEKPERIYTPAPFYPAFARLASIEGKVTVESFIDSEGCVTEVRLLRGTQRDLDRSALEAVKNWVFEPAKRSGKPVMVYYALTVNFEIGQRSTP